MSLSIRTATFLTFGYFTSILVASNKLTDNNNNNNNNTVRMTLLLSTTGPPVSSQALMFLFSRHKSQCSVIVSCIIASPSSPTFYPPTGQKADSCLSNFSKLRRNKILSVKFLEALS